MATSGYSKEFLIGYSGNLESSDLHIKVLEEFKILKILAVDAEKIEDLEYLRLIPNINFIEESKVVAAPKKFISKQVPKTNFKNSIIGIDSLASILAQVERPQGISTVKAEKAWIKTQGEKVRVLILDSGIDKTHPALVNNFVQGRNFINPLKPFDFEDNNGHGTHVAGTIAASGPLLGVAPKVSILAGKVCDTGCPSSAILRGVEWGINQGVDVINMSLGGGMYDEANARVYQTAEDRNVVVVAASGNDGKNSILYPAAYKSVFSVGAIDFDLNPAGFSNWDSNLDVVAPGVDIYSSVPKGSGREAMALVKDGTKIIKLAASPMTGSGVDFKSNQDLVFAGLGREQDYKGLNIKGKIALVERGDITFKEKHDNAMKYGASAIIVYNNIDAPFNGTLGENYNSENIAVTIDKESGERLVSLLKDHSLKITVAVDATDYKKNNGTSMATPHVTGVAALVRSANKKLTAKQVKEILRRTATKLNGEIPEKFGNGLVDAYSAVEMALFY